VLPARALRTSVIYPHSVFICIARISRQTGINFADNIDRLIFAMETNVLTVR